ncbi:hypothetical protein COB64_03890 [Candidatus Wolfebacteria bacterium]|nr:MAG: hypothetical protein COB64_03890 [Candidatus Wolfebacteria bacterium]
MDDNLKRKLEELGESLGEAQQTQKEQMKEKMIRDREFEVSAKQGFVRLRKDVILPFLDLADGSFKGNPKPTLVYYTNEQLEGVKPVTENFIKVHFLIRGGKQIKSSSPYIEFNLNPYQNIITVTKHVDMRGDKKFVQEHHGDTLQNVHVEDYLTSFVERCVTFYS